MHLKRYFCESGKEDKVLQDDVFIVSGERRQELFDVREKESLPKTWERHAPTRSIVLLGPPRQGKTTEFRYQCDQVKNGFFLPLGKVPTMGGLEIFAQAIEKYDRWMAWRNGEESGELFIDSLDEGKLATRLMMRNLAAWLRSLGEPILRRLRIHLSCRGAEWERADQDKWLTLFEFSGDGPQIDEKPKTVEVLVLLDLARSQCEEYCQAHGVDPGQLLNDLPTRARRFVARPQTLKMIVEDYRQSGQPPESITELYERVIARRLGEENPEHQQASRIIPIVNKRSVAELYAAITALSDRVLITDQGVDSLNSVPMGMGGHAHEVEEATFNSGLFQAPLRGEYRFDDPDLAYYLGACYLSGLINGGAISTPRAIRLFLANPEDKEPIPKLRGLMVWLCALNPGFRQVTITTNPGVLLDDFPVELNSNDKILIWHWLVSRYGDRRFFEHRHWWEGVRALACPEIGPHLQEVLGNPAKYGRDIRELALQVSLAGNLTQLGQVIELCCQDTKDDPSFLIFASRALKKLAPERVGVLKPWLTLLPEDDPNNRLLGSALEALWPENLSTEEMISYFRPPVNTESTDGLAWFLQDLPGKIDPDQRSLIIDAMAKDLETLFERGEDRGRDRKTRWSEGIISFLIPQVEAWENDPLYLPTLEKWLATTFKAQDHLDLFIHDDGDRLSNLLKEERNFRHALIIRRIERAFAERGKDFDPRRFSVGREFFPQPEELPFWKDTLEAWLGRDPRLIQVVWYLLMSSWYQCNNPSELILWVEPLAEKNNVISKLWDASRSEKIQEWRRQQTQREKEQEAIRHENIKVLNDRQYEISSGNINLLGYLYNLSEFGKKSIIKEYGEEVASAYHAGLLSFWRKATLTPLTDYFTTNSIPWGVLLVLGAVEVWRQSPEVAWTDLPESMRRSSLQAGLSNLNEFPAWYEELVKIEPEAFREIAFEALELETNSKTDYPTLAHRLKHNRSFEPFRTIALDYLKQNPTMRAEFILPLAEAQVIDHPSEEVVDFLWELGRLRLTESGRKSGLRVLALVWRYSAEVVWSWLNDNFFGLREARTECFKDWLNALSDMHISHRLDKWPAWVSPVALMALLPDYFAIYPPETDPSIEEFNRNIPDIQHRSHLAHLRSDSLAKIAESGSPEAGKFLTEWAAAPERRQYRDHILFYLDRWHLASTEKGWQPLSPQDLMGVLSQGLRPIRNHAELYDLVLEMVIAIKAEMEGGEGNLKALLWDDSNPAPETKLQILLAQGIRRHPLRSKVVGNREVAVSGENHPDLKIETRLEFDQLAVVYIEVKRQQHPEIFSAIESQLANKYLISPESRYGIYFVGWYGEEYWGCSQKNRREVCGAIPRTATDLEVCLQLIADGVAQKRNDIDEIKVIVVDLSLRRPISPPTPN